MDHIKDRQWLKGAGGLVMLSGIFMMMFILGVQQPAAAAPYMQPGRTPTPNRPATPTPTRTLAAPSLSRQVVFAWGGAAGAVCDYPEETLPAVEYQRANIHNAGDIICLMDFPQGEQVTARIYDPNDKLVLKITHIVQNVITGMGYDLDQIPLPALTNQAPAGRWSVVVDLPDYQITSVFYQPDRDEYFTLSKAVPPGTPWLDPRRVSNMVAGDTLLVDGVNYPQSQDFPVAIYRWDESSGELALGLMAAQVVHTDRNGRFSAGFPITSQYESDYAYVVAVLLDSPYEPTSVPDGTNEQFNVIQPQQVCQGAQPSLLYKGGYALVIGGPPNNVREKPGLNNRLIGQLYENETLSIVAGPKCADGMVWWKVSSNNTGMDGWTAEGQKGSYWLVPFQPDYY